MKIKNEEVKLVIGEKKYLFHNLILDTYVKKFIDAQLETDYNAIGGLKNVKALKYILLKLEEPLIFNTKSVLKNNDFDICILFDSFEPREIVSNNRITVQYFYKSDDELNVFDYKDNSTKKLSYFNDKKITAIAFNTHWRPDLYYDLPVCSVIDTSNYNLYLIKNQKLSLSRKDIIETDGIFKCDLNSVKFPIHLSINGLQIKANELVADNHTKGFGVLKSIGLASNENFEIEREFKISEIGYSVRNNSIEFNEIDNYLHIEKLFSQVKLFPISNLFPLSSQYRYIIFKYSIVQGDIVKNKNVYAERGFYYVAYPIKKYGKSKISIKYERG